MYGSYERTHSVFQNSDMMAKGKPSAEEVAVLEPFRSRLPAEVFGEAFVPPVSDGSGQDRALLRKATALLRSANCTLRNGKLYSPKGEQIIIEFLIDDQTFQPHHLPFVKNLAVLGIDASIRILDPVQYRARQDGFEFDVMINRMSFALTPGDGLRTFFTSEAAATKGSQNLAGIADPVIDALVDKIMAASTREDLNTACRALDRVFRAGRYWVPQWSKGSHWIAFWDLFGRPATQQRYGRGIPDTWWYDREKAAKMERAG
jgi:microcin C transport system substrate-binding protein